MNRVMIPPRVTSSFDWAPEPNAASVLKLAAWSAIGAAGVKYGELLCGTFFLEPTYGKALAIVARRNLVGAPSFLAAEPKARPVLRSSRVSAWIRSSPSA